MRIVSQDGCYDLPYEQTVVLREETHILVRTMEYEDLRIASYSTEEKAIKAMEMCREQYAQCGINKHLIQKAADNLEGVSITFAGEVRNQLADKYIFQFPADEEVKYERKI